MRIYSLFDNCCLLLVVAAFCWSLVVGYLTFGYFWLLWVRVREFEFKNFAFRVGNKSP